ncbi:MAG: DUF3568 family protein [Desulfobacterales bacterium]|nr:DUF3568 family protein [Desulfobacterales bacterium]
MSGCAALVVAAGAGAGAYTYVNGELARTYPAPYTRTMDVCTQILQRSEHAHQGANLATAFRPPSPPSARTARP